ncbi:hypothetical protein ACFL9U_12925 [Thermodesulfobacteriota bacterium]
MELNHKFGQLLNDLSEAKTWPDKFRREIDHGIDMRQEIEAANKTIEQLETRARQHLISLGCMNPQSFTLNRAIADMLISWYWFKDELAD